MEFHLLDGTTTFFFVLTFLLTDNRFIIIIVFTLMVLLYDARAGETPITTIPKYLLGRHELVKGLSIIISQIIGMVSAIIFYKFLIKSNLITKHKLE